VSPSSPIGRAKNVSEGGSEVIETPSTQEDQQGSWPLVENDEKRYLATNRGT